METEVKVVLERHEEQIKTLFKQDESINKRVDDMETRNNINLGFFG